MDLEYKKEVIHVGFIVDQVLEVLELEAESIEPAPTLGANYKAEFITGMARANDDFVMLLNMAKIFSLDEMSMLQTENAEEASVE